MGATLDQLQQPDLRERTPTPRVARGDERRLVGRTVRHIQHGRVPGHQPQPGKERPRRPGAACGPRSRPNSAANGATPTRRRACVSPGDDGVAASSPSPCISSRHTLRYPCPCNRVNATTNHTTTRDGNRRTRRWTAPVSAST